MKTPYSKIFKRFELQVTDYDLDDLVVENREDILIGLLNNACSQFETKEDLSRDDSLMQFNSKLSDRAEMILSMYMVQGWCKPYLFNQEILETHYQTMEYQRFSPAEKMRQMRELMKHAEREASRLSTATSVKSVIGGLR